MPKTSELNISDAERDIITNADNGDGPPLTTQA